MAGRSVCLRHKILGVSKIYGEEIYLTKQTMKNP